MSIFNGLRRALGLGKKAEDRRISKGDDEMDVHEYEHALAEQRRAKDRFFKYDPASPLTDEQKKAFEGLEYYPPNLDLQFELPLERHELVETITIPTSTGDEQTYQKIGQVRFEVEGQPVTLQIYDTGHGDYFVPFRDATSGKETYGAGRYLEPFAIGRDILLVDFNLAYNPYCAYNDAWSCPLPPIENWLKVPIRAGEKQPKGAWVQHEEPPTQAAG